MRTFKVSKLQTNFVGIQLNMCFSFISMVNSWKFKAAVFLSLPIIGLTKQQNAIWRSGKLALFLFLYVIISLLDLLVSLNFYQQFSVLKYQCLYFEISELIIFQGHNKFETTISLILHNYR